MKLEKIFICINLLILSLLMLTGCTGKGESWPRIVYQPTYWTFDNRIIANTTIHACESIETRIPQYVCGVGDKELREAMLDRINHCRRTWSPNFNSWSMGILWRNYLWR